MKDRIRALVAAILGVPVESVGDDASSETLPSWDSVNHMNVVVAVEEEFGVEFDERIIPRLTSLRAIQTALEEGRGDR